jgi:intracellular septation protein
MQALFDLAPLAAFFIAYYLRGIYFATAVLILSMLVQVAIDLLRTRRVPPMRLVSTTLVLLLGGATLLLHDARFLKWKPTVFLWLIALASVGSTWIGRAPLAQRLLQPIVAGSAALPLSLWRKLNWMWALFYALLGAANLAVAYGAAERVWVDFKVFGLSAAFFVFIMLQALWLNARAQASGTAAS